MKGVKICHIFFVLSGKYDENMEGDNRPLWIHENSHLAPRLERIKRKKTPWSSGISNGVLFVLLPPPPPPPRRTSLRPRGDAQGPFQSQRQLAAQLSLLAAHEWPRCCFSWFARWQLTDAWGYRTIFQWLLEVPINEKDNHKETAFIFEELKKLKSQSRRIRSYWWFISERSVKIQKHDWT